MKLARTLLPLSLAVAAVTASTSLVAAPAHAQAASLPSARSIVDRHVAAIGGRDAIAKITSMEMRATVEIPAAGLKADVTALSARPNRRTTTMTIAGIGEISSGFDGETAWEMNPMQGPRLLTGKELDAARDDADMTAMLYAPSAYKSIETVEATEFEGQKAYKVHAVRTSGLAHDDYFSVETGLLIGRTETRESAMGTAALQTAWSDYKEFGGIRFPTRHMQKVDQQSLVTTVSSVSFGTVPDSAFVMPAAIKALKK